MTIANKARERGDFICAEDGFYVYWPRGLGGALSAEDLRQLAAALDELNKEWEVEVEREQQAALHARCDARYKEIIETELKDQLNAVERSTCLTAEDYAVTINTT